MTSKELKKKFEKWRGLPASVGVVGGVLAWVVWVACLRE